MAHPTRNGSSDAVRCRVEVVWSPKRGVGASTIAAAAAVRYAFGGERTAVVDLADGDAGALVCLLSEQPRDPADSSRSKPVAIGIDSEAAGATISVYAPGIGADQAVRDALVFNAADSADRVVIDAGTAGPHLLRTLPRLLPEADIAGRAVLANCYLSAQAAAAALHDAASHQAATGLPVEEVARWIGYDRPIVVAQPDRYYTAADLSAHLSDIGVTGCSAVTVARNRHVAAAIDSASVTQLLPRSLQRFEFGSGNPPPYEMTAAVAAGVEVATP